MQRIALTRATPGMVLARAVIRPEGLVLVGEGQVLTLAVIDRIRGAGIGSVWVEGNPLGPGGEVGNLRVIAQSLPNLFRRQRDNVFMMTMCTVFERHLALRLAEQRALEDAAIERRKKDKSGKEAHNALASGAGIGA